MGKILSEVLQLKGLETRRAKNQTEQSRRQYGFTGDSANCNARGASNAERETIAIFESLMKIDASRSNDTRPDLSHACKTMTSLLQKTANKTRAFEYERKAAALDSNNQAIYETKHKVSSGANAVTNYTRTLGIG